MKEEGEDITRLTELAVDRLVGTLSGDEAAEYASLRAKHPEFSEADLERAVAVLHLASGVPSEPVPQRLQMRLTGDATDFFEADSRARLPAEPKLESGQSRRIGGGWFAAAACLIVALVIWEERPIRVIMVPTSASAPSAVRAASEPEAPAVATHLISGQANSGQANSGAGQAGASAGRRSASAAQPNVPVTQPDAPAIDASGPAENQRGPDAAAAREHLLATNPYVLRRAWRAGNDAAGFTVAGDVVWDPRSQTGFMRFVGLRRNEPNAEQYQLWIFDARRDDRYPVDGGVFNISGATQGDVIPIRAALRVGVPLRFAVTIERPGGVVVSDRSRIAALADTT